MKTFKITIDNGERRQEFEQSYAGDGYARQSLFHVVGDMLDSALKEAFGGKTKEYADSYEKFRHGVLTKLNDGVIVEPLND